MRRFIVALLVIAVVAFSRARLSAAVIPPIGLTPGSQYQLIFVTTDSRDARSSGIADYNAFVTAEAALNPSLPTGATWHAVASTATVNAKDNAPSHGLPVYNTAGIKVASADTGLYMQSSLMQLLNPIKYDQYGDPAMNGLSGVGVWTGSLWDGTGDSYLVLGSNLGCGEGISTETSFYWSTAGFTTADKTFPRVYALSSALTFVPEPSSLVLSAFGLAGLAAWCWRNKRPSQV